MCGRVRARIGTALQSLRPTRSVKVVPQRVADGSQRGVVTRRVHVHPGAAPSQHHGVQPHQRDLWGSTRWHCLQRIVCGARQQDACAKGLVGALQPRGCVHGVAHGGVGKALMRPEVPYRRLTRVQANAQLHLRKRCAPPQGPQVHHVGLHGQRAGQGTVCVPGVGQRRVPEGHDSVADEFVQRAAVLVHGVGHAGEVGIQRLGHGLGRQVLAGGGEACQVREQQCQHTALAMQLRLGTVGHQGIDHGGGHVAGKVRAQLFAAAVFAPVAVGRAHVQVQRQARQRGQCRPPHPCQVGPQPAQQGQQRKRGTEQHRPPTAPAPGPGGHAAHGQGGL